MSIKLTWLGHATWLLNVGDQTLLLDPFITDNPACDKSVDDLTVDAILISHGHFDHVADAAAIANKNDATLIAIYEIATWFAENHSVKNTIGMNIGGHTHIGDCAIKMTQAIHSSQLPDGSYGGTAAGFVVAAAGKKIYFACDTALFSDMQLIGKMGIDLAVLPIGDLFTMGVDDSIEAVKLLNPKQVLPTHYNTWPPIEQDANAWSKAVQSSGSAQPIILNPGDHHEL
jgi:L-ascorbate metabolism protein UlaG (beta-lactamase superfamily)